MEILVGLAGILMFLGGGSILFASNGAIQEAVGAVFAAGGLAGIGLASIVWNVKAMRAEIRALKAALDGKG